MTANQVIAYVALAFIVSIVTLGTAQWVRSRLAKRRDARRDFHRSAVAYMQGLSRVTCAHDLGRSIMVCTSRGYMLTRDVTQAINYAEGHFWNKPPTPQEHPIDHVWKPAHHGVEHCKIPGCQATRTVDYSKRSPQAKPEPYEAPDIEISPR